MNNALASKKLLGMTSVSRLLLLLLFVLIASCRSSPARSTPPPPDVEVVLDAPITFAAGAAGDRTLPVPMLVVSINGVDTRLILDTGASHHVLTRVFAERLHIRLEDTEAGRDHVGASIAASKIGKLTVQIGRTPLPLDEVASIAGPPPFEPLGIGGFLSPQHLLSSAHAVLDFSRGRLLLVKGSSDAVSRWAEQHWGGFRTLRLPRANADRKVMVHAAVEPHGDVVTVIDTGGSGTEFLATYLVDAEAAAPSSNGVAVSGAEMGADPAFYRNTRTFRIEEEERSSLHSQELHRSPIRALVGNTRRLAKQGVCPECWIYTQPKSRVPR